MVEVKRWEVPVRVELFKIIDGMIKLEHLGDGTLFDQINFQVGKEGIQNPNNIFFYWKRSTKILF